MAELRPPIVEHYFKRGKNTSGGATKTWPAAILTLEQNPPERMFKKYIKKILSRGFCSKVKIAPCQVFVSPPYFRWQLAFYWHFPTSGRQNRVKIFFTPLSYRYSESWVHKDSVGTCPEKLSHWIFSVFHEFPFTLVKKFAGLLRTQFWCHRPST